MYIKVVSHSDVQNSVIVAVHLPLQEDMSAMRHELSTVLCTIYRLSLKYYQSVGHCEIEIHPTYGSGFYCTISLKSKASSHHYILHKAHYIDCANRKQLIRQYHYHEI